MQSPVNDQEEVTESSRLQSQLQRDRSFPFAKLIVEDMGMRCIVAGRGPVRCQGEHAVAMGVPREGQDVELNLEPSQFNSFQMNLTRGHRHRVFSEIDLEARKLFACVQQFLIQEPMRGEVYATFVRQTADEMLDLVLQAFEREDQLTRRFVASHSPRTTSNTDSKPLSSPGAEPEGLIENRGRRGGDRGDLALKSTGETPEMRIKRRHGAPSKKAAVIGNITDDRGKDGDDKLSSDDRLSSFKPGLRPFDLHRGKADAIPFSQNLVGGRGLAIHPDQVVARLPMLDPLGEQLGHGGPLADVDVVSESSPIVVDVQNLH